MRILVLAPDVPFPAVGGGLLRTFHLLRALAANHELTLVAFTWDGDCARPPFPLRLITVPCDWPPLYQAMKYGEGASSRSAWEQLAKDPNEPWFVSCCQSTAMEETVAKVLGDGFDLILLEQSVMGRFLPLLPPDVPKVLDLHDVQSLIARRAAARAQEPEKEGAAWEADRTVRFETQVVSRCAGCITVSAAEAAAARELLGTERVDIVPNGVDTHFYVPDPGAGTPGHLLFTGLMNYEPNVEAVQFFTEEVLPLIRTAIPRAKLHIVGAKPAAEVSALASEGVVVHGFVPDLRPYYRDADVVVVPLLQGGGTRLKILEAAASGKAIVSTSLGAEGLDFVPGRDLMIGDSPPEFAEAVTHLMRDRARRHELGLRAREASLQYDWDRIGSQFCRVVEGIL